MALTCLHHVQTCQSNHVVIVHLQHKVGAYDKEKFMLDAVAHAADAILRLCFFLKIDFEHFQTAVLIPNMNVPLIIRNKGSSSRNPDDVLHSISTMLFVITDRHIPEL